MWHFTFSVTYLPFLVIYIIIMYFHGGILFFTDLSVNTAISDSAETIFCTIF